METNKQIEEITSLRIKIDGISQLVKELKPVKSSDFNFGADDYSEQLEKVKKGLSVGFDIPKGLCILYSNKNSKEINKTYNSLILAKAWLGKVLGEIGNENPYKNNGNRHEVKDIEPTADVAEVITHRVGVLDDVSQSYDLKNHIEKVDWLREEIKDIEAKYISLNIKPIIMVTYLSVTQHLSEARFWLGFELQRIREENNNN